MDSHRWTVRLYILNVAVLITHEIDSAYWEEWTLFGIPGGIQVFNLLNLAVVLVFLDGLRRLVQRERRGYQFSLLLVGAGLFAVVAHSYFLAVGRPEFRLPVSLALLAATFILSVAQGIVTLQARRDDGA
ncbi:hypothetical protein GJR96_02905 [Haloferax sp. MBLA0076]|uniref:Uncharacterized protein n=1 Tax=Haloferax litoreum TaxID=2666140 RepID=A0A6A8GGI3_9EURY|nr:MULTISPECIES: DUF6713 family protein [Haloferax]KAB1192443.1 hypothetical protein Hfx1148_02900 [Haloferax sp. CBA1148]MRX20910.1 hypothetical protein [Haloferax litoreum]